MFVVVTDEATEASGEETEGCDEKVGNSLVAGIRQTFPMACSGLCLD